MNPGTQDTRLKAALLVVLLAFAAYLSAASLRFRYTHPWMTETELQIHLFDALRWETIPR